MNSASVNLIDPATTHFSRDESGQCHLQTEHENYAIGSVALAFPLTSRASWVVVRDEDGEEIGIIENTRALDNASRKTLNEELEKSYFLPQVRDILRLEETNHMLEIDLETDKGFRTIDIRNVRKDVRKISDHRVILKDLDGNRYEIPDWTALSPLYARLLSAYL